MKSCWCALPLIFLTILLVPASDRESPHIVIYLSDDHSFFDTSLYGATDIPTPEMEKLAKDGMVFTHAFVASPSCAPSRAALLTGLMPARNGAEANHTFPRDEIPSLIEGLRECGYRVAAFGKVAHGKSAARFGFDDVEPSKDHEVLKSAIAAYIDSQPHSQKLCLFVGTSNPHVPWPSENSVDTESVQFPPIHIDTPQTRLERSAYYQEIFDLDLLLGELREIASEKLGKNLLFLHTSDHGSQWPFGKWNLYDYGTRVPLIVSWPGKIQPGSRTDAMVSWIDLLPTLIDAIGGTIPEGIDGRSLLPVLLGEKQNHRDSIFTTHSGDGNKNIFPIRAIRTKEWKLIHNLRPDLAHTNHSDLLRKVGAGSFWSEWVAQSESNARAKNIIERYYERREFELYHVAMDPWEEINLIDVPGHGKRIKQLKEQLKVWRSGQGDDSELFNDPRPISDPETWHPRYFGKHIGISTKPVPGKGKKRSKKHQE